MQVAVKVNLDTPTFLPVKEYRPELEIVLVGSEKVAIPVMQALVSTLMVPSKFWPT